MRLADLAGKRVAVWGYGREGRAALAALRVRVPQLRPTLLCSGEEAERLAFDEARSGLEPAAPFDIVTAAPDGAALSAFDVVVKSPGISRYKPEVLIAEHAGTHFTSGTALWFAEHPEARVIAVTGTKGKSTVSALVAHLLRSLGRRVALAGNIGMPLLELLDPTARPEWWVVELSSFQTRDATAVEVGVINNLYEEHLDWHGTRERYAADKLALAAAAKTLVVNARQNELAARLGAHPHCIVFGGIDGWHVADGAIVRDAQRVFDLVQTPLPGPHNALNLCAALAAIDAAGEDAVTAAPAIATFRPLPHRLQTLGERAGLTWIDDSIATTPQATLEALASLAGRAVTVLVGGFDRGLDWHDFAERMRSEPAHAIVTMGANGGRIHALLAGSVAGESLRAETDLASAVRTARRVTPPGGVVLLSPGAPSFDQFADYAARGRAFAALAGFEGAGTDVIEGLGIG